MKNGRSLFSMSICTAFKENNDIHIYMCSSGPQALMYDILRVFKYKINYANNKKKEKEKKEKQIWAETFPKIIFYMQ